MSGENSGSSYPALDATSPTDSVIAGDFGSLSAQEQERQRDEWKAELAKTEEEIITLKQVRFFCHNDCSTYFDTNSSSKKFSWPNI